MRREIIGEVSAVVIRPKWPFGELSLGYQPQTVKSPVNRQARTSKPTWATQCTIEQRRESPVFIGIEGRY